MKHQLSILALALAALLITVTLGATPAAAQTAPPQDRAEPRLVTVTGEAVVNVVPDEVVLTLGVESSDKQLRRAKSLNDDRVKQVLAAAESLASRRRTSVPITSASSRAIATAMSSAISSVTSCAKRS